MRNAFYHFLVISEGVRLIVHIASFSLFTFMFLFEKEIQFSGWLRGGIVVTLWCDVVMIVCLML